MTKVKDIHPVHKCNDGLFNAASGIKISLHEPTPDMITLEDIAIGLDNICRFGGQIRFRYPVSAHTLMVWYLSPEELKPAALLHDAAEAYLGDVIKPLKNIIEPLYGPIESRFEKVIFKKYHVDLALLTEIKKYDRQALEIEHAYMHHSSTELLAIFEDINSKLGYATYARHLFALLNKSFGRYEKGGFNYAS